MSEAKTKVTELYSREEIEEDAATVVIDFNAIKNSKPSLDDPQDPVEIQFQAAQGSPSPAPASQERKVSEDELSLLIEQDDDELDLEFGAIDLEETPKIKAKAILFDFKGSHLKELSHNHSSEEYEFITSHELKELNGFIKEEKELIIIFYYNQAPKIINSLMKQINHKFPHIKTVIMAKNLSSQKAAIHQKSPSGAKSYISSPESFDDVIKTLQSL